MNKKYAKSFQSIKEAMKYVGYFQASQEAVIKQVGGAYAVYAYTPEAIKNNISATKQVIDEIVAEIKKAA